MQKKLRPNMRASQFKYKYADLACDFCLEKGQCIHTICPHIIDCLDDLKQDKEFIMAVEDAKNCDSKHKQTLLHLKDTMRV